MLRLAADENFNLGFEFNRSCFVHGFKVEIIESKARMAMRPMPDRV